MSEENSGLEAFFEQQMLHVSVRPSTGKVYTIKFDVVLSTKKWYHIVLTHAVKPFGPSELTLYIDGRANTTSNLIV